MNRDFLTFSRTCIFFLLTLSRLWSSLYSSPLWLFPTSAFPCSTNSVSYGEIVWQWNFHANHPFIAREFPSVARGTVHWTWRSKSSGNLKGRRFRWKSCQIPWLAFPHQSNQWKTSTFSVICWPQPSKIIQGSSSVSSSSSPSSYSVSASSFQSQRWSPASLYPLVNVYSLQLKMAIEIVDLPWFTHQLSIAWWFSIVM